MAAEAYRIIYSEERQKEAEQEIIPKQAVTLIKDSENIQTQNEDSTLLRPLSGSVLFVPKTTFLRWPIIFFFINCIMIVSALSLCLAPASSALAVAYEVSILQVNMCGIIFTATFIPMTFISMWMYKAMGTHTVLRIASVLVLIGGWGRMFALNGEFWPILLG